MELFKDAIPYDSRTSTLEHIAEVQRIAKTFCELLSDSKGIHNTTKNNLFYFIRKPTKIEATRKVLKSVAGCSKQILSLKPDEIGAIILDRVRHHDTSKLGEDEKPYFDKYTPKLVGLEYGSPAYTECLRELAPALEHHYKTNRHHPEYHAKGISAMYLVDFVEMMCDWLAATKRHATGDIVKSLEINKRRFGIDDSTAAMMAETFKLLQESETVPVEE